VAAGAIGQGMVAAIGQSASRGGHDIAVVWLDRACQSLDLSRRAATCWKPPSTLSTLGGVRGGNREGSPYSISQYPQASGPAVPMSQELTFASVASLSPEQMINPRRRGYRLRRLGRHRPPIVRMPRSMPSNSTSCSRRYRRLRQSSVGSKKMPSYTLRDGRTKSCGLLEDRTITARSRKHGMARGG